MRGRNSKFPTARARSEEGGAVEFSYHRHAVGLRSAAAALGLWVVLDTTVVVALFLVLPPPWRFVAAGLGFLVLTGIVHAVMRVFRTRHRLLGDRLLLHFGYFRLEVPIAILVAAHSLATIPHDVTPAAQTWPLYLAKDDTLYLVPHREGLVELRLSAPLTARLFPFSRPVRFTRIVLAVDEPQAFLHAIHR